MKKIILTVFAFFLVASALPAYAGPFDRTKDHLNNIQQGTDLPTDLGTTIGMIVRVLLSLVGTIFLLLTIYAGILWMTAQGNEDKIEKAKGIVQAAVIGLLITMSAYAVTAFVTDKASKIGDEEQQQQTSQQ